MSFHVPGASDGDEPKTTSSLETHVHSPLMPSEGDTPNKDAHEGDVITKDSPPSFVDIFINRPVLAWVINCVICLLGLVAWKDLVIRQYPQVEQPIITIETDFQGTSPEVVEMQLTKLIEDTCSGVEGLDYSTSESVGGHSKVKLFFQNTRPVDLAAADVRDRLSQIETMPSGAGAPVIRKADTDADPVVQVVLYGQKQSIMDLYDYARKTLKPAIESILGVALVEVYGGTPHEIQLVFDPVRLAGYGLTVLDAIQAIKSQNLKKPGGKLMTDIKELSLTFDARLATPKAFENVIIAEKEGTPIYLSDVGTARLRSDYGKIRVRYNQKEAVLLTVIAQSKGNPLAIARDVRTKIDALTKQMPQGMSAETVADRSIFIKKSLQEVARSIIEAVLLVVLVVLAFLRSLRAALIPLVTIPISLLGGLFIMYCFGFSINLLTLLAMVLAIGLVVDDAIVVLENVHRYIERGFNVRKAALLGTYDIRFSVIAMTLTLVAVYAPLAFSTGIIGKFFTEFALTLAGTVVISGVVALVLSPMMCSRLLKSHSADGGDAINLTPPASFFGSAFFYKILHVLRSVAGWLSMAVEKQLSVIEHTYRKALTHTLRHPLYVILTTFLVVCLAYGVTAYMLPKEFVPKEDQGVVKVRAFPPYDANIDYIAEKMRKLEEVIQTMPEVTQSIAIIQMNPESYLSNFLTPWELRVRSCNAIADELRRRLEDNVLGFTGVSAYCTGRSITGGGSERPLQFVVQTTRSFEELADVCKDVRQILQMHPGIDPYSIDDTLSARMEDFQLVIDRERASSISVDLESTSRILEMLVGGASISQFEYKSNIYPVRVWLNETVKHYGPEDLLRVLFVRSTRRDQQGKMIPLSDFVSVKRRMTRPNVDHSDGLRAVTFMCAPKKGADVIKVYNEVASGLYKILPERYQVSATGELKRMIQESDTTLLVFGLAFIFIFLILAAQFESFTLPFVIILTAPLALVGALLTLWVVPGGTMNIYSQIGLITLIGLITKHGILMVDFAQKEYEGGCTAFQAALQAGVLRLRPILMTTGAMVLGALPLALATGIGSEVRKQIGWCIVGGMSFGTLMSLFVIPLVWMWLTRRRQKTTL